MTIRNKLLKTGIVEEISDERNMDAGIWIYFKPGWRDADRETHFVHEYNWADCWTRYKYYVEKCICAGCKKLIKGGS